MKLYKPFGKVVIIIIITENHSKTTFIDAEGKVFKELRIW